MADDVGSLLLRSGIVASEQLEAARQAVKDTGGTVPEQLVRRGFINDEELTSFCRSRLLIPRVNPSELAKLSAGLLGRLPADMATEFRAIPIALDEDGNLSLVMSDPSDTKAVDEIGFFTGYSVMRAIATQAQIAWCLAHYYKQKTGLYRDLVADGEWPESGSSATEEVSTGDYGDPEKDTAPMMTRRENESTSPHSQKKGTGRGATSREDDNTVELEAEPQAPKPARKRPPNQMPSPPELFARAGEIHSIDRPERNLDAQPAVLVSLDAQESGVVLDRQRGTDTAPIVLSEVKHRLALQEASEAAAQAIDDQQSGPIILDQSRRKRRTSRHTNLGVGAFGRAQRTRTTSGSPTEPIPTAKRRGSEATGQSTARPELDQPRSHDAVGGDEWGLPGTTIPPGFLGAAPSSYEDVVEGVPIAVEEDVTAEMRAIVSTPILVAPESDQTTRTDVPLAVRHTTLADAAGRLLVALRAIDHAESKQAVVAPLLDFLDGAFERTGFMALRQDDLVAWLIHGCSDRGSKIRMSMDDDSSFRSAIRMRLPYNGPIEDAPTKRLARDIDIPDALDLLALPLTVRERVVGVLFGMGSHGRLFEEHLSVLSQAASEAFEQILRNRRS